MSEIFQWCNLVPQEIEIYSAVHSSTSERAEEIRKFTEESMPRMADMLMPRSQASFIGLMVALLRPRLIFEVGTFTGYATQYMIDFMSPDARLVTCEVDERVAPTFDDPRVELVIGRAEDHIQNYANIDLAVIDGDKPGYQECYDLLLPRMTKGGLMLFDNTLWRGMVLGDTKHPNTPHLQSFNDYLISDDRVEVVQIPAWDGFTMVRVK